VIGINSATIAICTRTHWPGTPNATGRSLREYYGDTNQKTGSVTE